MISEHPCRHSVFPHFVQNGFQQIPPIKTWAFSVQLRDEVKESLLQLKKTYFETQSELEVHLTEHSIIQVTYISWLALVALFIIFHQRVIN